MGAAMYRPEYYKLYELVPGDLYRHYHGSPVLWNLFDDRILMAADLIREQYGSMIVNDWQWGGPNHYRGFRPADCGVGATLSQHKFGRALDLIPKHHDAETIRRAILGRTVAAGLVTCIEADVSWLHIDCRLPDAGQIKIIYPRSS